MKLLITLLMVIFYLSASAQFAIVSDKDGYVNVRKTAGSGNNILDKLFNGEIVYCFEPENDWLPVDYYLDRQNYSGYLHKSRVKFIENFDRVLPEITTDTSFLYEKDTFKLRITKVRFNPKKNKLQYQNPLGYLEKINGKQIWGTDGELPKWQYGYMLLKLGKNTVYLPVDNLFEPNLEYTSVNIDKNNTIYISALNSDGAGGYAVLWIIENGKFKERITTIPF